MSRLAGRDAGFATVAAVGLVIVLAGAGLVAALLGGALLARHRAGSAADLAALAGAVRLDEGRDDGCLVAARVAAANGGRLIDCSVRGLALRVGVAVDYPGVLRRLGPARERAVAGPADPPP
jgi:secretion/DNA translocation related TadE-like protein